LVTEAQIRAWVGKGASKLVKRVLLIFGKLDAEQHKFITEIC
jgi:phosphoglycolate phosphatase